MKRWLTPWHLNFFLGVFLILQAVLFLYLESTSGVTDRQERIRGRDFLHFYLAGRMVAEGRSDLLYDQERFLELQKSISPVDDKNPPYVSVYPPHSALLFSLLGRLPYPRAVEIWWLIQLLCIVASASLLVRYVKSNLGLIPAAWYVTIWLGIFAFNPILNTFWNGQISALLLLLFVAGFTLHNQKYFFLAGMLLSLISLKPQLAVGLFLWLVLRRDYNALLGMLLGGLLQLTVVIGILGPEVIGEYLKNARLASSWYAIYTMSPDHQHALAGILTTWFGSAFSAYAMLVQTMLAAAAGYVLWNYQKSALEYALAIIFTLCCAPHLLTYDLSYLLIAVATFIVSLPQYGMLFIPTCMLYAGAMFTPLYVATQVSLVPLIFIVILIWLRPAGTKQFQLADGPLLAK
ncbi:MAG TPA: glycosyltransferase family 87 protein [Gemmatales bacterium]|nr:glycosyltransferase family 87 protein [Gemmatales bacterium]HMP17018.1 glycosyltransferase family 87 protein [Gemmatales bacterium]